MIMHPCRFIVPLAVAAAVLLAGRAEAREAGASGSGLGSSIERRTFTLGGTTFAIDLPKTAVIMGLAYRKVVTFDLTKGLRLQRTLAFSLNLREATDGFAETADLANGGRLDYAVEDNTGGGSGGPIAELAGRMMIGSHVVSVTCTDQDEGVRDPRWCVPYIKSIAIVAKG